jgi:carboxymethylenebutenolidase
LRGDWLGLYGDQDAGIPMSQIDALELAASTSSADTQVIRYPDAGHGFNCNDRPDHFNAGAASDAWTRTLDFLRHHLES